MEIQPVDRNREIDTRSADESAREECAQPERPPAHRRSSTLMSLKGLSALIFAATLVLGLFWHLYGMYFNTVPSCDSKLAQFMQGIRLADLTEQLCGNGFTFLDDVLHLSDQQLLEEVGITNAAHRHRIIYKSEVLRHARQHASGHWSLAALLLMAATACVVVTSASAAAVLYFVPGAASRAAVVVTVIASEAWYAWTVGKPRATPPSVEQQKGVPRMPALEKLVEASQTPTRGRSGSAHSRTPKRAKGFLSWRLRGRDTASEAGITSSPTEPLSPAQLGNAPGSARRLGSMPALHRLAETLQTTMRGRSGIMSRRSPMSWRSRGGNTASEVNSASSRMGSHSPTQLASTPSSARSSTPGSSVRRRIQLSLPRSLTSRLRHRRDGGNPPKGSDVPEASGGSPLWRRLRGEGGGPPEVPAEGTTVSATQGGEQSPPLCHEPAVATEPLNAPGLVADVTTAEVAVALSASAVLESVEVRGTQPRVEPVPFRAAEPRQVSVVEAGVARVPDCSEGPAASATLEGVGLSAKQSMPFCAKDPPQVSVPDSDKTKSADSSEAPAAVLGENSSTRLINAPNGSLCKAANTPQRSPSRATVTPQSSPCKATDGAGALRLKVPPLRLPARRLSFGHMPPPSSRTPSSTTDVTPHATKHGPPHGSLSNRAAGAVSARFRKVLSRSRGHAETPHAPGTVSARIRKLLPSRKEDVWTPTATEEIAAGAVSSRLQKFLSLHIGKSQTATNGGETDSGAVSARLRKLLPSQEGEPGTPTTVAVIATEESAAGSVSARLQKLLPSHKSDAGTPTATHDPATGAASAHGLRKLLPPHRGEAGPTLTADETSAKPSPARDFWQKISGRVHAGRGTLKGSIDTSGARISSLRRRHSGRRSDGWEPCRGNASPSAAAVQVLAGWGGVRDTEGMPKTPPGGWRASAGFGVARDNEEVPKPWPRTPPRGRRDSASASHTLPERCVSTLMPLNETKVLNSSRSWSPTMSSPLLGMRRWSSAIDAHEATLSASGPVNVVPKAGEASSKGKGRGGGLGKDSSYLDTADGKAGGASRGVFRKLRQVRGSGSKLAAEACDRKRRDLYVPPGPALNGDSGPILKGDIGGRLGMSGGSDSERIGTAEARDVSEKGTPHDRRLQMARSAGRADASELKTGSETLVAAANGVGSSREPVLPNPSVDSEKDNRSSSSAGHQAVTRVLCSSAAVSTGTSDDDLMFSTPRGEAAAVADNSEATLVARDESTGDSARFSSACVARGEPPSQSKSCEKLAPEMPIGSPWAASAQTDKTHATPAGRSKSAISCADSPTAAGAATESAAATSTATPKEAPVDTPESTTEEFTDAQRAAPVDARKCATASGSLARFWGFWRGRAGYTVERKGSGRISLAPRSVRAAAQASESATATPSQVVGTGDVHPSPSVQPTTDGFWSPCEEAASTPSVPAASECRIRAQEPPALDAPEGNTASSSGLVATAAGTGKQELHRGALVEACLGCADSVAAGVVDCLGYGELVASAKMGSGSAVAGGVDLQAEGKQKALVEACSGRKGSLGAGAGGVELNGEQMSSPRPAATAAGMLAAGPAAPPVARAPVPEWATAAPAESAAATAASTPVASATGTLAEMVAARAAARALAPEGATAVAAESAASTGVTLADTAAATTVAEATAVAGAACTPPCAADADVHMAVPVAVQGGGGFRNGTSEHVKPVRSSESGPVRLDGSSRGSGSVKPVRLDVPSGGGVPVASLRLDVPVLGGTGALQFGPHQWTSWAEWDAERVALSPSAESKPQESSGMLSLKHLQASASAPEPADTSIAASANRVGASDLKSPATGIAAVGAGGGARDPKPPANSTPAAGSAGQVGNLTAPAYGLAAAGGWNEAGHLKPLADSTAAVGGGDGAGHLKPPVDGIAPVGGTRKAGEPTPPANGIANVDNHDEASAAETCLGNSDALAEPCTTVSLDSWGLLEVPPMHGANACRNTLTADTVRNTVVISDSTVSEAVMSTQEGANAREVSKDASVLQGHLSPVGSGMSDSTMIVEASADMLGVMSEQATSERSSPVKDVATGGKALLQSSRWAQPGGAAGV